MPLTKQYLRYEATTSFGVICSRKTGPLLLKVARKGTERLVAVSPALEHVIIWDIKTGDKVNQFVFGYFKPLLVRSVSWRGSRSN